MSGVDDTTDDRTPGGASDGDDTTDSRGCDITVHDGAADRVIFTETDNENGWIATDTTVDVER